MRKPDTYALVGPTGRLIDTYAEYWHADAAMVKLRDKEPRLKTEIREVCLVKPELLDWVEKMRKSLQVGSSFDIPASACEELLSELEAMCPSDSAAKAALDK